MYATYYLIITMITLVCITHFIDSCALTLILALSFQQPYYVKHQEEYFERIKKYKSYKTE